MIIKAVVFPSFGVLRRRHWKEIQIGKRKPLSLPNTLIRSSRHPIERSITRFFSPSNLWIHFGSRRVSVTGLVKRGTLQVGDSLEIVGLNDTKTLVCTGIDYFEESQEGGLSGDIVGVSLSKPPAKRREA